MLGRENMIAGSVAKANDIVQQKKASVEAKFSEDRGIGRYGQRVPSFQHSFNPYSLGLYATQDIAEGEVVFTEDPLFAGQYSWGVVYG